MSELESGGTDWPRLGMGAVQDWRDFRCAGRAKQAGSCILRAGRVDPHYPQRPRLAPREKGPAYTGWGQSRVDATASPQPRRATCPQRFSPHRPLDHPRRAVRGHSRSDADVTDNCNPVRLVSSVGRGRDVPVVLAGRWPQVRSQINGPLGDPGRFGPGGPAGAESTPGTAEWGAYSTSERCGLRTQNSFPSGSARTTQLTSPWPTST